MRISGADSPRESAGEREADREVLDVADADAEPELEATVDAQVRAEAQRHADIAVAVAEGGDDHRLHVRHQARVGVLELHPAAQRKTDRNEEAGAPGHQMRTCRS